ncbi:MAG: nucleotidyltransferase domain-containing protein [Candidatus Cloacimonetes bacterium]|nr:nucleotidyltransferase domain-containing protein [Candidatus Cloacimonadota bacterium]
MATKKISDPIVIKFAQNLKKNLPTEKLIFFGSRARGKISKYSDYDFVVVSPAFQGKKPLDRSYSMYQYWPIEKTLEALCYTPEEFKEMATGVNIVSEAVKTGIQLI